MKLLIIGATGGTGKQLVQQALEQGHQVTVLARQPEKLKEVSPALRIIKGNVLNLENVMEAVAGQDAVLSALGHKRFFIPTSTLSEGTKNIIQAMESHQVNRFLCITSLGINDSRFRLGLYYTLFVIPFIVFFYFWDKARQEKLIRGSRLKWTIIRPGQLTNSKKRGKYRHSTNEGHYIFTRMISRADVADFMLKQLTDNSYVHKAVGITN